MQLFCLKPNKIKGVYGIVKNTAEKPLIDKIQARLHMTHYIHVNVKAMGVE